MTITTINNGVSLPTSGDTVGAGAAKTALQTGTTGVILNAQFTPGNEQTGRDKQNQSLRVHYAISPFSVTAAAGVTSFAGQEGYFDLRPVQGQPYTCQTSGFIINNGGYLYTWYDSPSFGSTAALLTVTSVELP